MRVCEAARDLRRIVDRDGLGKLPVGGDDLGKRRSVDEFHDDVIRIAFAADVVRVDDVRMRQARRRFGLLIEAPNELLIGGVLLAQHLDGDAPAQQDIGAAEYRRHPAFAELAVEPVAVVEDALVDQRPAALQRRAQHVARDRRGIRCAVADVLDDDRDGDARMIGGREGRRTMRASAPADWLPFRSCRRR